MKGKVILFIFEGTSDEKTLENNIKFKNEEKNSLEKIIEKREKALYKYLENNKFIDLTK